jgi:hypothetical protein
MSAFSAPPYPAEGEPGGDGHQLPALRHSIELQRHGLWYHDLYFDAPEEEGEEERPVLVTANQVCLPY